MLTAREPVGDRVAGLEAGADDYLVQPFALEELLARLKALLRRVGPDDGEDAPLRVDSLTLDPAKLRSTDNLERVNKEIAQRSDVVGICPATDR